MNYQATAGGPVTPAPSTGTSSNVQIHTVDELVRRQVRLVYKLQGDAQAAVPSALTREYVASLAVAVDKLTTLHSLASP